VGQSSPPIASPADRSNAQAVSNADGIFDLEVEAEEGGAVEEGREAEGEEPFMATVATSAPLNGGLIVLTPSNATHHRMARAVLTTPFDMAGGWGGAGWGAWGRPFHGCEGPQGFLHHYFFRGGGGPGSGGRLIAKCDWNSNVAWCLERAVVEVGLLPRY